MSKYVIGLDLGLKGGIVVLKNKKIVYQCVMPIVGGKEVNNRRVAGILNFFNKRGSCHLVFEKFGGFFGYAKKATASLSRQQGNVIACAELVGMPYTTVTPQQWQKVCWVGVNVVMKKSGGKKVKDTKAMALIAAKRLFPSNSFLASKRSFVPHDGIVDSALLAIYGERKGL